MSVILSVKLHHTAYSRPYQYSIIHSPTTKNMVPVVGFAPTRFRITF